MSESKLRVEDAKKRDVGRGIARIDQRTMRKLGVSAGDVIEIAGKRTTSAIAWPAYSEDQNREIIRIDNFTRKNADAMVNTYVSVRKASVKDGTNIILGPIKTRLNVDEDFMNFVKNRLMERTFIEGDTTLVMMLGHTIPFIVVKTTPQGIVKVTNKTFVRILNEFTPERKPITPEKERLLEKTTVIKEVIKTPCPKCGALVLMESKYCPNCGHKMK